MHSITSQSRPNSRTVVAAAASPSSVSGHTLPKRRRRKPTATGSAIARNTAVLPLQSVNHAQLLDQHPVDFQVSSSSIDMSAAGSVSRKHKRTRFSTLHEDADTIIEALVSRTHLPQSVAEKVVQARAGTPYVTSNPDKLCARVQALQQLLGPDNAAMALKRHPALVAYSPATLAYNCSQWQLFFGMDQPSSAVSSPLTQQLQQARQEAVLRKLAQNPRLLGTQVEQQVANLYEAGTMLGHQDMHSFAYRAAGLAGPDAMQEKLLLVLDTLNSHTQHRPDEQPHQHHPSQQQQQQPSQLLEQQPDLDRVLAAEDAHAQQHAQTGELFSLSDVQAAARRDQKWLQLSVSTLEQRLKGMQQELGLSMFQVGRMFLRNPSLLNKKPSTLASKAAALRALPGLQPDEVAAAMVSLPSLLNLDSERLRSKWMRLQQAADSHPAWRQAFDRCSPSIKASMLIKGDRYYQRLHRVVDMGLQEQLSPSALLNGSDGYFEKRIAKATAKAAAKAAAEPDARAAAVAAAAAAAAAEAAPAASDTPLR